MMELHDRFEDWLVGGAEGEPPRDLALHAWSCDDCLRAVAAIESLQAIDVGAAPLPPLSDVAERSRRLGVARLAVGGLAAVLLGVSFALGASGLLRPATPAADAPATRVAAEGVLFGAPTADPTATSSPSDVPSPTESLTPIPSPTAPPAPIPAPAQPAAPPPAPPPPPPPPPTPAPTAAPTAAPSTPVPSAAPTTPPPTPTPTLEPSPTPSPDDCEDGIDNDGDTFVDLLDPGCVLTGNEPDA